MENKFYTVDEVAEILNIHSKTVRKYIREGKLKATKVGKQWRITGHDLSILVEGENNIMPKDEITMHTSDLQVISGQNASKASVSTVIDIQVSNQDEIDRISNTLLAVMNSKDPQYGHSTINIQFIEKSGKLRVMLWGTIYFTEALLSSIAVLIEENNG
ncbi:helix-turn-helix domain-containing protein [Vallitalea okinawensis]|uniref:helix-turn-helix domain-containing protein n=1 Tax=Vallitalea okinawensis TaxID=2078660 RepID=UPI000CFD22FE|nr:helix-turn-helix domain-containing protein [Vallitalea okinawensis]